MRLFLKKDVSVRGRTHSPLLAAGKFILALQGDLIVVVLSMIVLRV